MDRVLLSEVKIFVELRKEGYSFRRIAEKMERSKSTVMTHVYGYEKHGDDWFSVRRNSVKEKAVD